MLSVTSYLIVADRMKGDKLKCVALRCQNNSKWCQLLAAPTGFTADCHLCVTLTNSRPEVIYSAPTRLVREYSAIFLKVSSCSLSDTPDRLVNRRRAAAGHGATSSAEGQDEFLSWPDLTAD